MASDTSKELLKLAVPFQRVAHDLRNIYPLWEELAGKAVKVQRQLEASSAIMLSFFETLQKVADAASSSSGNTRDLGTCLTKITLRHRNIAQGYAKVSSAFGEDFARTVVQKMDDRRKSVVQLEREHDKDFKRWKSELKKVNIATLKLNKEVQKKKKGGTKEGLNEKLDEVLENAVEQYEEFEAYEQLSLRHILLEQRLHYCAVLQSMQPFLAAEVNMLDEVFHLQEVQKEVDTLINASNTLPKASMDVASNLMLDVPNLFTGASAQSPVVAQVRKQADARAKSRNSMISLMPSDSFSMDSLSVGDAGESSSSASLSFGSPSLSASAVRLEPEGSSGAGSQHTPEQDPAYADIEQTIAQAEVLRSSSQTSTPLPSLIGETSHNVSQQASCSSLADKQQKEKGGLELQNLTGRQSPALRSGVSVQKPVSSSSLVSQTECIYSAVDADEEWPAAPDDLPLPPPPEELDALSDVTVPEPVPYSTSAVTTTKKATPATRPKPVKAASSFSLQQNYVHMTMPTALASSEYAQPEGIGSAHAGLQRGSSPAPPPASVCQYEDPVVETQQHQIHQMLPGSSLTLGSKGSTASMVKNFRRRTGSFGSSDPTGRSSPSSPALSLQPKSRLPTSGQVHGRGDSPHTAQVITMDV